MTYAIEQIDPYRWRVPRQGKMRTDGLVFASSEMMADLRGDQAIQQVMNVAQLPGIVGPAIAMPDIHWGYGFPIGGVAAFDHLEGVISPGGVGYDINCGVRLLAAPLAVNDVRACLPQIMDKLFDTVPSGVGASRSDIKLSGPELDQVLSRGAGWAVQQGYGTSRDVESTEGSGALPDADPSMVSPRAKTRGRNQLGTIGSGNHFVEVGYVSEDYDPVVASRLGLTPGTVTVFIHCGSRGLGHQVCDDFLDVMLAASRRYHIDLPDPQLCCAPLGTPEANAYWGAMNAAANYAFANRQVIAHYVRRAFADCFGEAVATDMTPVYDVAHNIAKLESHHVEGRPATVCVHRKGATRAFPPGHAELHPRYRDIGQPVLIPGDMGRYSYVMTGTDRSFRETFGSSCHGAGRRLSRHAAKKLARPRNVPRELEDQGIILRAASRATVDEELPEAYKDVQTVVHVVEQAGIGRKVAQLKPLGVVKG